MHKFRTQLLAATAILALTGGAHAAELPVKAPPVAPVAPVINWTGFYVGAQIGGASFDPSCHTSNFPEEDPCFNDGEGHSGSLSSGSVLGGGRVGYDYQWGKVVWGVVGQFDWTDLNNSVHATFPFISTGSTASAGEKIDWLASVRGRVGWAFDSVLFYATGGVAWTDIKTSASFIDPSCPACSFTSQSSSRRTGAVAGGGFEYRFTPNVSVFGELLWYGFGTSSTTGVSSSGAAYTTQFTSQDILAGTLGVNYRF
jgi:outer membrane immunogenic protein